MEKILVDSDRLDLLVEIVVLSGYCILNNNNIVDCFGTDCNNCVFNTYDGSSFFVPDCRIGIKDFVKGD